MVSPEINAGVEEERNGDEKDEETDEVQGRPDETGNDETEEAEKGGNEFGEEARFALEKGIAGGQR